VYQTSESKGKGRDKGMQVSEGKESSSNQEIGIVDRTISATMCAVFPSGISLTKMAKPHD
jgi:hypothetical protein